MTVALPLVLVALIAQQPAGSPPALAAMVPPDAVAVLTIDGLRDRMATAGAWPMWESLREVPAYKAWRASTDWQRLDRARRDIETLVGAPLEKIRDDLLGDAVAASLHFSAEGADAAPALLVLMRPRDRALLKRALDTTKALEQQAGNLAEVETRTHQRSSYEVRRFKAANRPVEYYGWIAPGVFAWTNAEPLIQGAIEQAASAKADVPAWVEPLRSRLPARAMASLYLHKRLLDRMGATAGDAPGGLAPALPAWAAKTYAALQAVGLAFDVADGLELQLVEQFDTGQIDPGLARLTARGGSNASLLKRVPDDAMAVASGRVDWSAAHDLLIGALTESERTRVAQAELFLSGLMLGRDFSTEVLPALGPGFVALMLRLDESTAGSGGTPFPRSAIMMEIANSPAVAQGIDNALRSVLALLALDPKRPPGLKVESVEVQGTTLTRLAAGPLTLAFHVSPDLIVLGNSEGLVADLVRGRPADSTLSTLLRVRAKRFPEAQHFVAFDFQAVATWLDRQRNPLAAQIAADSQQKPEEVAEDIEQALRLLRLFQVGYLTAGASEDGRFVHQSIGLLPKAKRP